MHTRIFFNSGGVKEKPYSPRDTAGEDSSMSNPDVHDVKYSPPNKTTTTRRPSLLGALFKVFWKNFLLSSLFKFLFDVVMFVQPQLLK